MVSLALSLVLVAMGRLQVSPCDSARTTLEMQKCLSHEIKSSEERLKRVEDSLVAKLSPRQVVVFRRASAAWMLFRDLECESEAERFSGGTMAAVVELECRLALTDRRRKDVRIASRP